MLYRISVTERGLTGIANIFRSRLSRLDDLLGAGTVPLNVWKYEGKTILDKFLLRVNIGGEIVWRFFTCTETICLIWWDQPAAYSSLLRQITSP